MHKKSKDLKDKITDAVNRSYEYEKPKRDFVVQGRTYWVNTRSNLMGNNIKEYDIYISCDDVYAIEGLILILLNNEIKIFKNTTDFKLKLVKTLKSHLLIFLIKKKSLNVRTKYFFYKMLLHLIKNQVARVDSHLEGIMLYLDIDRLVNIVEYSDHFSIFYLDGKISCFNERLERMSSSNLQIDNIVKRDGESNFDPINSCLFGNRNRIIEKLSNLDLNKCKINKINKIVETYKIKLNSFLRIPNKDIYIRKNKIYIFFDEIENKKEILMENIKQVIDIEEYLIIRNENTLKIIYFY